MSKLEHSKKKTKDNWLIVYKIFALIVQIRNPPGSREGNKQKAKIQ
jgi:hypothetical protein